MAGKAEQSTPVDTGPVYDALRAAGVDEEKSRKATHAIQNLAGWNLRESLTSFQKNAETRQIRQDTKLESLGTEFNAKLEGLQTGFNSKIENFRTEFNAKIESLRTEFNSKIESLRTEFNAKLESLRGDFENLSREVRLLRWMLIVFFALWTFLLAAAALGWFGPRVVVLEAQSAATETVQQSATPAAPPPAAVAESPDTQPPESLVE